MDSSINFIGRNEEIEKILGYIKNEDIPGKVIFIMGKGGFGKTRLLYELPDRIKKKAKALTVNQVIDFDNKKFNSPESISSSMIKAFSEDGFEGYYESLEEMQKIERLNLSINALEETKRKVADEFIEAYNEKVSGPQIWIFDTIEKLCEFDEDGKKVLNVNEDILNDWIAKIKRLKNTYFIFWNRPLGANFIKRRFRKRDIDSISITLKPFSEEESRSYIAEKQENLNVGIKEEQVEKLIMLAGGKPILLDLAVEWFIQELDMALLNEIKIPEEKSLKEEPKEEQKRFENKLEEFEKKLVGKISELRSPLDSITFALAHVYPLDNDAFNKLFEKKVQDGMGFDDVKKIVYIKTLPNGAIKLHDEMDRLVKTYLFDTLDKDLQRRSSYSKRYLSYLQTKYDALKKEYDAAENVIEGIDTGNKEEKFRSKRRKEEKEVDFNWFTIQLIIHSLYANKENGIQKFTNWGVEQVEGRFKKGEIITLFKELNEASSTLSLDSDPDFVTAFEGLKLLEKEYGKSKVKPRERLEEALGKANDNQKIEIYFLLSNDAVRQGKVSESIKFLKQAETLNEKIGEKIDYSIKLDIEQGWNYRLIGDFEKAKEKYEAAIFEILEKTDDGNWNEHTSLAIRYGWTLNNLAFALTNSNETRRSAVDIANSAISHWKAINNKKGLGAGYSVSGITYYRIDNYENALKRFREALRIFEELKLEYWLCQIYSWRGATYQDRAGSDESARKEDLVRAEEDFERALEIAEKANRQIIPMTLNRLGRIYMTRGDWPLALEKMKESLRLAKDMPDYLYWLGSIGRIGLILPYYSVPGYNLEKLKQEYRNFKEVIQEKGILEDYNSMGIVKIAFAYLEIIGLQKKPDEAKVEETIKLLKEGIPLIVWHGSFGRTDIITRLGFVENELKKVKPTEIIRKIGGELLKSVKRKVSNDDDSFLTAVNILNKWKNWKDDK